MNPIFYHEFKEPIREDGPVEIPGWYFWNETQAGYYGPYATKNMAMDNLSAYAATL